MKNITKSLIIISAVAALAIGGTIAYFSDTEQSTGNTITAGTIDLAVNGQNPLAGKIVEIKDIKPSENVPDTEVLLNNVGSNDGVADLHILTGTASEGVDSEPECAEQGAGCSWNNTGKKCEGSCNLSNICTMIDYDYTYDSNGNGIKDTEDMRSDLSALNNVYLDVLPAGITRKLWLSHHLKGGAGNEYQGDVCTYDIKFSLHQLSGDPQSPVISFVDVGNLNSEDSKDMKGWSHNVWGGSGWGGGDDQTIRTVSSVLDDVKAVIPSDPLNDSATVVMDFGSDAGTRKLQIRHLDGLTTDSFNVYVDGVPVGSYTDSTGVETWMTLEIPSLTQTGVHTVKIVLNASHWGSYNTYGQLGISWIKIVK